MIHFIQYLFHVFLNWSGASNPAGTTYGFWSGFGSDLGEFAIIVGLYSIYKKHNCHIKGCWRIAHHQFIDKSTGDTYLLCRKHHPNIPKRITIEHILHIHKHNKKV